MSEEFLKMSEGDPHVPSGEKSSGISEELCEFAFFYLAKLQGREKLFVDPVKIKKDPGRARQNS